MDIPTSNSALAGVKPSGVDSSSLKGILVRSGIQKSDPPAFQTINNLIDGVKLFQDFAKSALSGLNTGLQQLSAIVLALGDRLLVDEQLYMVYVFEYDSSTGPKTFTIATDYVQGFVIIKDIGGMASSNFITISGTVDNVLDPFINTDFGVYRLYKSQNGNFYSW